jgi:hypothetical protein
MDERGFLWSRYSQKQNDGKVFLLRCGNPACKSRGGLLHRLHHEGVKDGAQCPACFRASLAKVSPEALTLEQIKSCLVEPSFLSSHELQPLMRQFSVPGVSRAVVELFMAAAAGEIHYRTLVRVGGQDQKDKYHAYIRPPGEEDIWLARAILSALRIPGGPPPPTSGAVGVCLFGNGSAEIGFSGDADKSGQFTARLNQFIALFKSLYPELGLALAMEENKALVEKYYATFKVATRGGGATQSTWARYCVESKFLDLNRFKRQPMSSCTVLWIGLNPMNTEFCLLGGRNTLGSPMLPCGHCQELRKFLDEL